MSELNQSLRDKIKADPKLMAELWKMDYLERPVDIDTFICDDRYIGKATDGGKRIFPVWREALREAFTDKRIVEVIATGSIGTGKSSFGTVGMLYVTYRTLCLRVPYEYYGILVGKPLSFVFFSMTLSLSSSANFVAYQRMMQNSPWFMERGEVRGSAEPVLYFPLVNYKLSSPRAVGGGSVGSDVVCGLLDEINNPGESVSIKERTFRMYEGTMRRIESRFMDKGQFRGMKLFLCASKDDELSFVDKYIEQRAGHKDVMIVDKSIWEVKPDKYCGKMFPVVLGDAYHDPKVITEDKRLEYEKLGHKILDVPIEHYNTFVFDTIGALRDVAGITAKGLRKRKLLPNTDFLRDCYLKDVVHPFSRAEIDMNLFSKEEIVHYLKVADIQAAKSVPRYVHIDIGVSGDSAGIACSYVEDMRDAISEKLDGTLVVTKLPVVRTEWVIRVHPEQGSQIPIAKLKKFIFDLIALGFNIRMVTMDGYQSTDLNQTLIRAGIESKLLSVDKTADPYNNLKDLIFEKRWSCYKYDRLQFELANLEIDPKTGKIDHPHMVKDLDADTNEFIIVGSKDVSDAVAGSCFMALAATPVEIDGAAMTRVFDKTKTRPGTEDDLTVRHIFKVNDKQICGVRTGGQFTNFTEIFNKIHNRQRN